MAIKRNRVSLDNASGTPELTDIPPSLINTRKDLDEQKSNPTDFHPKDIGDDESSSSGNGKASAVIGRTYADIFHLYLNDIRVVPILLMVISFFISPDIRTVEGILGALKVGAILIALWFFLGAIQWAKNKIFT